MPERICTDNFQSKKHQYDSVFQRPNRCTTVQLCYGIPLVTRGICFGRTLDFRAQRRPKRGDSPACSPPQANDDACWATPPRCARCPQHHACTANRKYPRRHGVSTKNARGVVMRHAAVTTRVRAAPVPTTAVPRRHRMMAAMLPCLAACRSGRRALRGKEYSVARIRTHT
jgi:hypothetical protein